MLAGDWRPICGYQHSSGRHFSNNNYGASLFCQKLDSKYTHGIISRKNVLDYVTHYSDIGIVIGECQKDDKDLFACTGGCGQRGGCDYLPLACFLFKSGTVEVKCFEGMEHQNGTSKSEMTTTNTTSKLMGKLKFCNLTF